MSTKDLRDNYLILLHMTHVLAKTHYVVHSLKNILFIFFKLRVKYKSQSIVRSLNHRHRKNKIPCFIFMNTRNVFCFTISHIYSCLHLLLQTDFLKISNSSIQSSLPPWKTLKILWQKQKMSHKSPTPGESTLELYKKYSLHVLARMLLRTIASTLQKPLSWYSHVFLENQMVREPFQVNSGRKNSHSFILDWKTLLNFWGGREEAGLNSESHNSSALPFPFDAFLLNKCLKTQYNCISSALLCYIPNPLHKVMVSCIFVDWTTEVWKRKKRAGSKREVNDVLHSYMEHRYQTMVDSFSSESGLFWGKGFVFDYLLHFSPSILPHWEIQSIPLLSDSSILTCQNPFKSSSHCLHTYMEIISVYPGATHQQKL